MAVKFVDVNKALISAESYREYSVSETYGVFAEFFGKDFKVVAHWDGKILDGEAPREYWQPYKVSFYNLINKNVGPDSIGYVDVKYVLDPSLTTSYSTVTDMIEGYRELVKKSSIKATGEPLPLDQILESELDFVDGFIGAVPKSKIALKEELLEELEMELSGDAPSSEVYGDSGW